MISFQVHDKLRTAGFIEKFRYACDRQTNSDLSVQFNSLLETELNAPAATNLTEIRDRITPLRTKYAEIDSNERNRQDFINKSFFVMRQIYRLANWIFSLFKSYVPNPTYQELERVIIHITTTEYGIKVGLSEIAGKTFSVFAQPKDNDFKEILFYLKDEVDQAVVGSMKVSLSEKKCISINSIKNLQTDLVKNDKETPPTLYHLMTQVAIEIFYRSAFATMKITTPYDNYCGYVRISEEKNINPKLLLKKAGFDQSSPKTSSKRLKQSFIFSMSKREALAGGSNTLFYTKSPDGLKTDVMVKRDWRSDWANDDGKYQRTWESVIAKTPILTGAGPVLPE